MSVNAAQAASAAQSSPAPTTQLTTGSGALSSQESMFLKLLTTQAQNQDPSNPMDDNTMMQETATLASLQAQTETNTALQNLASSLTASQLTNSVGYIGKSIYATGDTAPLVNGSAVISYSLPSASATATMTVTDAKGNVVASGKVPGAAGLNEFTWDGTDNNGQKQPDGTYTYKITATDAAGKSITPTTYTAGVVTAVELQNGSPALIIGNTSVPLSDVQKVGG